MEGETNHPYRVQCEQFHVVKYLLQMDGIDLSIVREGDTSNNDGRVRGRNAIHYAAYYNTKSAETLKILLNYGKVKILQQIVLYLPILVHLQI